MANVTHQILFNGRPDEQMSAALTELEVTESVRGESRFRFRLASDVDGTDFQFVNDKRLVPGQDRELTIVAFIDQTPEVLVHGIIQGRESTLCHGGAGSFLDIQGTDRRVLMDRNHSDFGAHSGAVPTIVAGLLTKQGFVPDIEFVESEIYTPITKTLNQTASDLKLVQELAAKTGVEFWIDWKLTPGKIVEIAHFRSQPARGTGGALGNAVRQVVSTLGGKKTPVFRLNTGDPNYTIDSFRSRRKTHMPNESGPMSRVNVDTGRVERTQVRGPSTPTLGQASGNAPVQRAVMGGGNASEARRLTEAALNDASWTVEANVETTAFQLGSLVRPRQVVRVQGAGSIDDGEYFVWSVQHRATEVGHDMDIQLRRNGTGQGSPVGGLL